MFCSPLAGRLALRCNVEHGIDECGKRPGAGRERGRTGLDAAGTAARWRLRLGTSRARRWGDLIQVQPFLQFLLQKV
jgi:hypothetical protein